MNCKQFLNELKKFLHNEWCEHLKAFLNEQEMDDFTNSLIDIFYYQHRLGSNLDTNATEIYNDIFEALTGSWEKKLIIMKENNQRDVSEFLDIDNLKIDYSKFIKEKIPQVIEEIKRSGDIIIFIDEGFFYSSPLVLF